MAEPEDRELLRQTLDEHRREFRMAVEELKGAARSLADPRDPIRDRPLLWLVGGLFGGFWLGWRS